MNKIFPAKVLLIGEYTVIHGGDALSIPLQTYYGHWQSGKVIDQRIQRLAIELSVHSFIDSTTFLSQANQGLTFESTIPEGYGLGSSGALTAAVYDKFYTQAKTDDFSTLRNIFAVIENHFHGKSSGFDPLVSYFNKPIVKKNDHHEILHHFPGSILKKFYLINSNQPRQMDGIHWFNTQLQASGFRKQIHALSELNTELITKLGALNMEGINDLIQSISTIQFQLLMPLITEPMKKIWQQGFIKKDYFMKLCGKGAGGYYLAYINNPELVIPPDWICIA